MKSRGFSLIELIVVMSIMTVIAGMALPVMFSEVKRQKVSREKAELARIKEAVDNYFSDTSAFPKTIDDLLSNKQKLAAWAGPYYSPGLPLFGSGGAGSLEDEWGGAYKLTLKGSSELTVLSPGPDGKASTKDDLSVTADATFIRRRITKEELDVINSAILSYNKVYVKDAPLPPNWNSILLKLVGGGFLPAGDTAYQTDGWGKAYQPDPPGVAPVVRVTSTMGK